MGERFKNGLLILVYSIGAGLMLAIFSMVKGSFNLVFSLLALVIGILFFRKFPAISSRIVFILLAILFFFVTVVVVTTIQFARSNPGASQAAAALSLIQA